MKKTIISSLLVITVAIGASAQMNHVTRIPEVKKAPVHDTHNYDSGFWISAEASAGYSLQAHDNVGFGEVDVTLGYRFNEFFRIGPGAGFRYYFPAQSLRENDFRWAFPLYVNFRGNILSTQYRSVVPYYSLDLGGTIQDGFMWRPAIGIRVGQSRQAFIASIAYTGQNVRKYNDNKYQPGYGLKSTSYVSFLSLRLGFEF